MKRRFAALWLLAALLGPRAALSAPRSAWDDYRRALVAASTQTPEARVQIWSEFLAEHPASPYRHRALAEIKAASRRSWDTPATPSAAPVAVVVRVEEVAPVPAAPPAPLVPSAAPSTAGQRAQTLSLAATFGGAVLGAGLAIQASDERGASLGAGILLSALVAGPSAGQWAAGDREHFWRASTARAAALGAAALGAYSLSQNVDLCLGTACLNAGQEQARALSLSLLVGGLISYGALARRDLRASDSAKRSPRLWRW
jgi:hypothetical protein